MSRKKRNPMRDAIGHVRGESLYLDDIPTREGTLHLAIFDSPVAHGHLTMLDISRAEEAPGVVAILTAEDVPGQNQIGSIIQDEALLCDGEVHFMGQPIAIVAATSEEEARAARELIEVEIEEYPVVTCPREAAKAKSFFHPPRTFNLGNVDIAWDDCEYVFEGQADCNGQEHLYLECQGAYAFLQENGHVRVYSSTQGLTAVQRICSRILGKPMHQIEVEVTRLGGGFGGKEDQATPWACMAALAATVLKRPAKLVLHRMDDMRMTGKRHPYSADYKIGLDKNLNILAYETHLYQNGGAAADLSPAILERSLFHHTNSYFIPNSRAVAYPCRTNLPPNTAFRGFGGPQAMFIIESAICHAAEELGIRAHEIQGRNLLEEGDELPYGQHIAQDHGPMAWHEAREKAAIETMEADVAAFNASNKHLKQGVAHMPVCFGISFTNKSLNQASALIHIYNDGSISLSTAAVEMGQGVNMKMAQVAATVFGISLDHIRVEPTNTSRVANTSPSAASSTADLNGKAVEKAACALRERLYNHVCDMLEVDYGTQVEFRDDVLYVEGEKTKLRWSQVTDSAYWARVSLSESAHYATPHIHFDKATEKGEPFAYHVFGTAIFKVTVDAIRGRYDIDHVEVVHDFGNSINPHVDLGQIEGGLVQGVGWMTMEEIVYNDQGRLLSNALSTYKIPDIYSVPKELNVHFLEVDGPELASFRSKAVGEPPLMYGIGAYFALRDAIRAFRPEGDIPFDAPMTPERVLFGLYGRDCLEGVS